MFRKLTLAALAAFTLGIVGLGFGSQTASAEVTENYRAPALYPVVNPCDGSVLTLQGLYHRVDYTTPDGTIKMRFNAHYTATDSAGTEYVVNIQRRMEHWDWPDNIAPFTEDIVWRVTSKGNTDNATIELTVEYSEVYPAPTVVSYICRG